MIQRAISLFIKFIGRLSAARRREIGKCERFCRVMRHHLLFDLELSCICRQFTSRNSELSCAVPWSSPRWRNQPDSSMNP